MKSVSGAMASGLRPLTSLLMAVGAMVGLTLQPLGVGKAEIARAATPALVGFSFSPRTATWLGEDSATALDTLLRQLTPDLVRLPVYWDSVEARPGVFDFSETDRMLGIITAYNRGHPSRPARVVLVAGLRNMGYPELYVPAWIPPAERDPASKMDVDPRYQGYLVATVVHYRGSPLLQSWQIENEPLDNVPTIAGTQVDIDGDDLQDELEKVRAIDNRHPIVITTYNSATLSLDMAALSPGGSGPSSGPQPAGHPLGALQLGDALGLDLYVVTGDTSLTDASAHKRIDWKSRALVYWAGQAEAQSKPLWITEMQGAPWPGQDDFTPTDLLYSASAYRRHGASVILLWGVESWLGSDTWMQAGRQARTVLSS
jgi:hypothetical protein